jgi:uncharacterized membrane protein
MPPDEIHIQQFGKIARVDRHELERAQWFWKKRPSRLVLADGSFVHIVLVCIVVSLNLIYASHPESCYALIIATSILAVLWVVGVMVLSRYVRWKSDYCRAIIRLVQTITK